jgi:MFS family permease
MKRHTVIQKLRSHELGLVAGLSLIAFMNTGVTVGSFALLIAPMRTEMGWTAAQASRLSSSFFFASACAALMIGWLLDRLGPRALMIGGSLLATLSYVVATQGTHVGVLTAMFVVVGIGSSAITLSTTYVVVRRVKIGVGLTMGLMMCGVTGGLAVVPIITEAMIAHYGWRVAVSASATVSMVTILLIVLIWVPARRSFIQPRPTDQDSVPPATPARTPAFRLSLIILAECLFAMSAVGLDIHFVSLSMERGFTREHAVLVLSAVNVFSALGPIAIGWLADKYGPFPFLASAILSYAFAQSMINLLNPSSSVILIVASIPIWGISSSSFIPLAAMVIRRVVPAAALGRSFGFEAFFMGCAYAIGSSLMGSIADSPGGYSLGLKISTCICLSGLVPLLLLIYSLRKEESVTSNGIQLNRQSTKFEYRNH